MDLARARDALHEEPIADCPATARTVATGLPVAGGSPAGGASMGMAPTTSREAAALIQRAELDGGRSSRTHLVAGATQLAIFERRRGLLGNALGDVIAVVGYDDIALAELRFTRSGSCSFALTTRAGERREFEVARSDRPRIERLHELVRARTTWRRAA
jgi:hypothetical protein